MSKEKKTYEKPTLKTWGTVADDRGYIDKQVLRGTYEKFLQGIMPRYEFWWALSLEMWLRSFFS